MLHTLPDTPLDIIGDIHGELEALKALLHHLGYRHDGSHPQGRQLVFVGDLCDRGPDSPGVIALVRRLVEAERAQAILGNHEINLLRGECKEGNNWFWNEVSAKDHKYEPYARAASAEREGLLSFLEQLPLALQRDDLRIVHAAWDDEALQQVLARPGLSPQTLFAEWDQAIDHHLEHSGLLAASKAEMDVWRHALDDSEKTLPLLEATGRCEELRQRGNPIRVLVSGMERLANEPFYGSGQWRFADRVKWWDHYHDSTPVVVGHYWRSFKQGSRRRELKSNVDRDLFEAVPPNHWHGARGNVFCADFSVGRRFEERFSGQTPGLNTHLAALRWPERTLVLDSGEMLATGGYGG
jgi:hypothetical protein